MASRTLYMHTIDGRPAEFQGFQICFANMEVTRFAGSLQQLRREQRLSRKNREARGWNTRFDYGYVRIKIRRITE